MVQVNANAERSHYSYDPSIAAAAIFAALYCIAFILTFIQWIRYRSWVWVVMVLGAAMEGFGYIIRCISAKHVDDKAIYVAQFSLVVLAPVLMAAGLYVIFGRVVFHVVPAVGRTTRLLWVPPRFVTPIFVVGDIICLLLQLWGAVRITSVNPSDPDAKSKANKGKKIALIGVALQLVCFGFFCIVALRFNITSKRFAMDFEKRVSGNVDRKYVTIDGKDKKLRKNWQQLLHLINIGCLLIFIRTIYRTADFSLGRTGYTEEHEWCTYIFDAVPIFFCVSIFIYFHPGQYLPYLSFRIPKHARQAAPASIGMTYIAS